jgi:DNA topoisomerase 2-associated protein PAT1
MVSLPTRGTGSKADLTRNKIYAYFLSILLPHLSDLFPSSLVQRNAFGPGAYLMTTNDTSEEMERRDAEVWGFTAALAVNAPEEEQANLVGALREKILHTVQSSRAPGVSVEARDRKLRNVNMFLHGLVSCLLRGSQRGDSLHDRVSMRP